MYKTLMGFNVDILTLVRLLGILGNKTIWVCVSSKFISY